MSQLVTGEAVVLGLRSAKLPSRALAIWLDLAAEFAVLIGVLILLEQTTGEMDEAAATAIALGLMVFCLVGVPVMVETLSRGRSLGKLALGLRVVRTDGGPVRFRHALVRGLVGFVELLTFMGVPAIVCSLISPEGRRLGDVFAGTLVVRERVPGAGGGRAALPPLSPELMQGLGSGLVALDLSAVPDGLWLAIRQYLGRIGQLDPAVGHGMALRLVGDLVARTGQPAPYGVPPAAYLGAVLAERQRRDWERSLGHQAQQAHEVRQAPQMQQAPTPQAQPAAPEPQPQPTPPPTGFAPPA
ncbi:RDD family protein [Kitasatospora sp. NPDC101801]|uniref:RDD family protein n=1 Tax=Kitasatospora sp. NPDC101801 TaxID=3364103 RepID=UPI0038013B7B